MKKIGVAVVGYGYWGPNLVRNFVENNSCRLVTVCDKDEGRLAAVRSRYPGVGTERSFEAVLKDPAVEAVALATPVSTHCPLGRKVLEAGKHLLVEKPLAASLKEAQTLVDLAARRKRVLMVGHTFLYSPSVRKVKKILDGGEMGRVFYMDFSRVNLGLFQPDVNVIWDLGPHDISIVLYWLRKTPRAVRAEAASFVRGKIDEVGYLSLEYADGTRVHIHLSWLAPVKLRQVSIVAEKKMLVYADTANTEQVKIYNRGVVKNPETFGEFQLTYRSGDVLSPKIDTYEPLGMEIADFLASIRSRKAPVSSGRFGLEVVRVLEAAQKSLARGGTAVRL